MSYIQRELNKIEIGLREPQFKEQYAQLYAAQQALSWVLEPSGIKSPYNTIIGTQEDLANCQELSVVSQF